MIYLVVSCRVALALILFVAGTSKIQSAASYREFRDSLKDLGLPIAGVIRPLSIAIPLAEGVTALLLAVNRTSRWGLVAAVFLLGALTAGIAIATAHGRVVRCRCFGESGPSGGTANLARNTVLLTAAAAGALASLPQAGRSGPAMVTFAIGLGLIAAGLFLHWDELAFVLTPASSSAASRRMGRQRSAS